MQGGIGLAGEEWCLKVIESYITGTKYVNINSV